MAALYQFSRQNPIPQPLSIKRSDDLGMRLGGNQALELVNVASKSNIFSSHQQPNSLF
jgi:hypothetical protein